jgi:hypothetical protein
VLAAATVLGFTAMFALMLIVGLLIEGYIDILIY